MPNLNKELIDALVKAFNVNNCTRGIMDTNFTTDGHHITTIFGGGMGKNECTKYSKNLKDGIQDTFYYSSSQELKEKQGPFYFKSFPFNTQGGKIFQDQKTDKFKYEVPIDDKVLFNLQAHLIYSMTKPTVAAMNTDIHPHLLKNEKYIMCDHFDSEALAEDFKQRFCAEMLRELKCDLSSFVTVEGRNVYISKDIVNNLDFIQRCVLYNAGKIGCTLEIPGIDNDSDNISQSELVFQELLTQFIYHTTDIVIDRYYHAFSKESGKRCLLLPAIAIKDERGNIQFRYLNALEAQAINAVFDSSVVTNLAKDISDESIISEADKRNFGINGINFSNREVSQHVCNSVFGSAEVAQVNEDEYGLEVQSSPHLDKLRAKVDEMREKEAQLQEAQSRAGAAQSYAKAAQSHAEEAKLRAEEAKSCANTTLSSTESAQLRAEATQSSAKAAQFRVEATHSHAEAAQWYAEAAYLRAEMTQSAGEATQLRAEAAQFCAKATRLYAEVTRLQKEIEAKGKKQKKVYADACHQVDSLDRRSITSGSSDDTDNHPKVSYDPNGGWQGASRSHPAGSSGGTDPNAGKKGQGQGRGGSQDRAQGHHRSTKLPYGTHPDYVVDPGYCGSSSDITGGLSGKTAAKSASADKSASVDKLKNPDSKKRSSPYTWIKSFFSRSKKGTTPLKRANSESGVSESGVFVNTPAQTPGSTPKTVRKSPNGLPNGANTNLTGVRTEQTANVAKESCVVS